MPSQGKAYTQEQQEVIIRLTPSYDEDRALQATVSTCDAAGRVAKGLPVSLSTVQAVLAESHRPGQVETPALLSHGKPGYRVGRAVETVIRQRVRELNRRGEAVSIRRLRSGLSSAGEQGESSRKTLGRTFSRLGFVYGPCKRRSTLKEQDDVLIARREYWRQKRGNRCRDGGTDRPEGYLDDTYLNVNHAKDNTWYFEPDGPWVNKPAGQGPRLIIVHALTHPGWVHGAKRVFQATQRPGDDHGQMKSEHFTQWFTEQRLPHLPPRSLIVRDNAPSHKELAEEAFPTPKTRQAQWRHWLLTHHPTQYGEEMLKPER